MWWIIELGKRGWGVGKRRVFGGVQKIFDWVEWSWEATRWANQKITRDCGDCFQWHQGSQSSMKNGWVELFLKFD